MCGFPRTSDGCLRTLDAHITRHSGENVRVEVCAWIRDQAPRRFWLAFDSNYIKTMLFLRHRNNLRLERTEGVFCLQLVA
jgi:hypothetical protein